MYFQTRLYDLRRRAGLSQEDLANVVGVTRQAVQKWESGASRPDMENLITLARYFGVTLDFLITGEEPAPAAAPVTQTVVNNYYRQRWEYEYKSRRTLWGLPLVHVHFCERGFVRAKGIVALGNVATGVVAAGVFSAGILSAGCFSLGLLLSLGCLAAGFLAVGGLAAGAVALGGVALGWLALGGVANGVYAAGGVATASEIAVGGVARAPLAIGRAAEGARTVLLPEGTVNEATRFVILGELSTRLGDGWLGRLLTFILRRGI